MAANPRTIDCGRSVSRATATQASPQADARRAFGPDKNCACLPGKERSIEGVVEVRMAYDNGLSRCAACKAYPAADELDARRKRKPRKDPKY